MGEVSKVHRGNEGKQAKGPELYPTGNQGSGRRIYIYIYIYIHMKMPIYAFLEYCTSPTSTLRCPADVAVTNPSQRNSCELEEKWLRVLVLHVELWWGCCNELGVCIIWITGSIILDLKLDIYIYIHLLAPFGSLWIPFGYLLAPFGFLLVPFGSFLAPFWFSVDSPPGLQKRTSI